MNSITDSDLLKLAAKAEGYGDIRCFSYGCMDGALIRDNNGELSISWNPLTDDGDALRLAVKLKIELYYTDSFVVARAAPRLDADKLPYEMFNWYNNDICAATRAAIVRAAAEIGKNME